MQESVHQLGPSGSIIGILSPPEGDQGGSDVAAIVLNAGLLHRVGPFRLHVDIARHLASNGIPALRIDQSGKGDSERRPSLSFLDAVCADYDDATAFLKSRYGVRGFILIGLCSGADDALYVASQRNDVVGAVLLDGFAVRNSAYYFRHYAERIFKWGPWRNFALRMLGKIVPSKGKPAEAAASPGDEFRLGATRDMTGDFRDALARNCRFLCLFSGGVEIYYNHEKQLSRALGLSSDDERLVERFSREVQHTYPIRAHKQQMLEQVASWALEKKWVFQ